MSIFAFVVHHDRPVARELVHDATAWLEERGHEVRLPTDDAAAVGMEDHAVDPSALPAGLDLGVSVGGDGTMLRAVDLLAPGKVPVLGVNVGHLGYLTTVEPDEMRMALKRFLSGAYEVEERMLLRVTFSCASGEVPTGPFSALNEAVLEKTPIGHTVRLAVDIDGDRFTTYAADGLIVATPTGSTAYSFSARGPIVAPTHRALLLTPVSPHMLFDRTLILEPDTALRIEVLPDRPATVSVDGRNLGDLAPGDSVSCTAGPNSAHLVTFRPRDFLSLLKTKFGLEDR
jgi:NAD+ kinase